MPRFGYLIAAFAVLWTVNVSNAAWHGGGHGGGHGGHWIGHHGRYYGADGYVAAPDLDTQSVNVAPAAEYPRPLALPTLRLSCHHSQEILTVPSEGGSDRKVTVTRC